MFTLASITECSVKFDIVPKAQPLINIHPLMPLSKLSINVLKKKLRVIEQFIINHTNEELFDKSAE